MTYRDHVLDSIQSLIASLFTNRFPDNSLIASLFTNRFSDNCRHNEKQIEGHKYQNMSKIVLRAYCCDLTSSDKTSYILF